MSSRTHSATTSLAYDQSGPGRWILSHVLRYPLLPVAQAALIVAARVLGTQSPIYLGRTLDHILSPGRNLRTLLLLSLAVVGYRFAEAALDVAQLAVGEFLSRRVQRDARGELYASLLGKSLSYHSRQRTGDLITRVSDDTRNLNYMLSPGLRTLYGWLVGLVVPLFAIGTLAPALLAVPMVAVAVLVVSAWQHARRIKPVADELRAQLGQMNAALAETLSGIEVVKASATEREEKQAFAARVRRARELQTRYGALQAAYLPNLVRHAMLAAGFVLGLLLYTQGAITIGSVVAFAGLLSRLTPPGTGLLGVIVAGLTGAQRILAVTGEDEESEADRHGFAAPMRGEVAFEDVGFGYDGAAVLQGITFHARPGETVAIVGPTGSGKSTLTRLINRIYDVDQGRVLVDGVDVREWDLASLRSQISMIEQDVFLFGQSVRENIAFGGRGPVSPTQLEQCARDVQAHEFVTQLPQGYETLVGERGVRLSGGQRQRIAIARALLGEPRVLILDDATSAVDSATEDRIQSAIERVRRGRTTFLITHRLALIRRADHVLVLRRGRLIDQGTHEELIGRCATYRRIFARAGRSGGTARAEGA
jgi:ATP-binding cassette, subfamily B, bacterial